MPFVRRLYQAHGDEWYGIAESQEYINKKVAIANQRIHGTTRRRPADVFSEEERAALKSLPAIAYEIEEFHEGPVRKDGHVRFRNKYYSVEESYGARACPPEDSGGPHWYPEFLKILFDPGHPRT